MLFLQPAPVSIPFGNFQSCPAPQSAPLVGRHCRSRVARQVEAMDRAAPSRPPASVAFAACFAARSAQQHRARPLDPGKPGIEARHVPCLAPPRFDRCLRLLSPHHSVLHDSTECAGGGPGRASSRLQSIEPRRPEAGQAVRASDQGERTSQRVQSDPSGVVHLVTNPFVRAIGGAANALRGEEGASERLVPRCIGPEEAASSRAPLV